MLGDAAKATPGGIVVSHLGTAVVLWRRKTGEDAAPLPGWWLVGGGGLADRALESDRWALVDGVALHRFLTAPAEGVAP